MLLYQSMNWKNLSSFRLFCLFYKSREPPPPTRYLVGNPNLVGSTVFTVIKFSFILFWLPFCLKCGISVSINLQGNLQTFFLLNKIDNTLFRAAFFHDNMTNCYRPITLWSPFLPYKSLKIRFTLF